MSRNFIQPLIFRIRNDEYRILEDSLNRLSLSLDRIDADSATKLIMILLKEAVKYDKRKCCELLIKFFAIKYHPDNLVSPVSSSPSGSILDIPEDEISGKIVKFLMSLIENPTTEPEIFKYCFILSGVTVADVLMEVLLIPDQSSVIYLMNAIDILGPLSSEQLEHYSNLCIENENYVVADFFSAKLRRISNYQIIPDHMYNFLLPDENGLYQEDIDIDERDLPTEEQCADIIENILQDLEDQETEIKRNIDKMSNEELTAILTSGIGIDVFDPEEQTKIRLEVLEQVRNLTDEEKIEKIEPFLINSRIDKLKDNLTVFRILGPIHQIAGINYEQDDIYKHCMFTCDYYDWDEESEETIYWFKNYCEFDSKHIRRFSHAKREPQLEGGWRGCYCSWECVEKRQANLVTKVYGMNEMINTFKNQMERFGTQDQVPDGILERINAIEERREGKSNGKVETGVLSRIPETDIGLVREVEEAQREFDREYEEENLIKLEDLIPSHYLNIKISDPLTTEVLVEENDIAIPISPSSNNNVLEEVDVDSLILKSIREQKKKQQEESEIPIVTLPE